VTQSLLNPLSGPPALRSGIEVRRRASVDGQIGFDPTIKDIADFFSQRIAAKARLNVQFRQGR